MGIERCHNVADFRRLARRRLPAAVWHYLEGGADDEWTLRHNTRAFADLVLLPRVLTDVSEIRMTRRVLGMDLAAPILLSPTGMSRLFHHERELAVARSAARLGLGYTLSTVATASIEEIAQVSSGPKMFQVYVLRDRGITRALVERVREAGYEALCLTVDTPMAGNRERDLKTGMALPPKFTPSSLLSFALHPGWSLKAIGDPHFRLANLVDLTPGQADQAGGVAVYINAQFDRSLTWKDAEWLAELWGGPFAIKGVMDPEDAERAHDHGASAVMLSNHGGRQLDGACAPIEMVGRVRERVGDRLEVILDGGVRRGSHIVKALAAGADAVSIGRPYLYGLAGGGEAGVARVLSLLIEETHRTLALIGCADIDRLDRSFLRDR